jgi:F0F1-type ATP synthase delta subunit
MSKLSRRTLANYAVEQLVAGKQANQLAKHLAAELIDSGRSSQVQFLLDDIIWQLEKHRLLVIGRITGARNLSPQLKNQLSNELKKITKAKEVILEENLDKSVLGGLRIETSEKIWDQTIARKLEIIKETARG